MISLISPKRLRRLGIVGMNQRNAELIARHNPRHLYPLVDNKLKTKLLAQEAGIAVPELLGKVSAQYEVKRLADMLKPHQQFVVKPAQGSGGKGILVVVRRDGEFYFKPSGEIVSAQEVGRHVSNILSGLYSLGGKPDTAMLEALVQFDPIFNDLSYQGIPDIRVIVYKGFPVMSMLRLATRVSDGKANLHQGAVGVGIDMGSGSALHAVQFNRAIKSHPDTRKPLSFEVPHWKTILELAASCYDITELGYLGVDIVLDKVQGPLIIELNARPGLAIQVANRSGLASRIKSIDALSEPSGAVTERAQFSLENFFTAPGHSRD